MMVKMLNKGSIMIGNYIDSIFSIDYLKEFDFIVALGISSKNIYSNICINPFLNTKTNFYIRYEAGTEEGVSVLFLYDFYKSLELKDYIEKLDYGYLTSETNISEEEMKELKRNFISHKKPLLLVGSSFYTHKRSLNILNIFSYLAESINIAFLSIDADKIYTIKNQKLNIEPICDLPENNGCMVYIDSVIKDKPLLCFSNEFSKAWRIGNNDYVEIIFNDFKIKAKTFLDPNLSGVIGLLSLDKEIDCGYRYKQVVINKI